MLRIMALLLAVLLLAAAGCSTEESKDPGEDGAGTPDAPPTQSIEPTDLVGTTWRLSTVVDGRKTTRLPKGAKATLAFTKKAVQTHSGCNSGGGRVKISDDSFVFGPLMSTLIGCPERWKQQVEQAYGDVLRGRATYVIEEDRLTISKGDASLGFVAR